MENYALYIHLAGLAVIALGLLGLIVRAFRHWRKGIGPLGMIILGLAITAFPPTYQLMMPVDLGPRERIVNGRRTMELTGWDRKDYTFLKSKSDIMVLQMANSDVTDETLENLRGMSQLEDLDLNNTKVTDVGLRTLQSLPLLQTLRLKNTKISDEGFRASLAGKDSLLQLDLTGTGVSQETANTWRQAKKGRRVMR